MAVGVFWCPSDGARLGVTARSRRRTGLGPTAVRGPWEGAPGGGAGTAADATGPGLPSLTSRRGSGTLTTALARMPPRSRSCPDGAVPPLIRVRRRRGRLEWRLGPRAGRGPPPPHGRRRTGRPRGSERGSSRRRRPGRPARGPGDVRHEAGPLVPRHRPVPLADLEEVVVLGVERCLVGARVTVHRERGRQRAAGLGRAVVGVGFVVLRRTAPAARGHRTVAAVVPRGRRPRGVRRERCGAWMWGPWTSMVW